MAIKKLLLKALEELNSQGLDESLSTTMKSLLQRLIGSSNKLDTTNPLRDGLMLAILATGYWKDNPNIFFEVNENVGLQSFENIDEFEANKPSPKVFVQHTIDLLEKQGYISRKDSPYPGTVFSIKLEDKAMNFLNDINICSDSLWDSYPFVFRYKGETYPVRKSYFAITKEKLTIDSFRNYYSPTSEEYEGAMKGISIGKKYGLPFPSLIDFVKSYKYYSEYVYIDEKDNDKYKDKLIEVFDVFISSPI